MKKSLYFVLPLLVLLLGGCSFSTEDKSLQILPFVDYKPSELNVPSNYKVTERKAINESTKETEISSLLQSLQNESKDYYSDALFGTKGNQYLIGSLSQRNIKRKAYLDDKESHEKTFDESLPKGNYKLISPYVGNLNILSDNERMFHKEYITTHYVERYDSTTKDLNYSLNMLYPITDKSITKSVSHTSSSHYEKSITNRCSSQEDLNPYISQELMTTSSDSYMIFFDNGTYAGYVKVILQRSINGTKLNNAIKTWLIPTTPS